MSTRNPLLIAAVAVVLAGFGFYHFALSPKYAKAKHLQSQVDTAQSQLDTARAELASNLTARRTYQSSYSQLVRLGKAVPADDDVKSLMVQLDAAAKSTHVNFESIASGDSSGAAPAAPATSSLPTGAGAALPPGATVGTAGFPVMPFSFTFKGEFFRMSRFFQRVDDFVRANHGTINVGGRLLTIDAVKLAPASSGFPDLEATVSATSYLVSPLEGPTAGATLAGPAGATTETSTSGGTSTPTTTAAVTAGGIR